MCWGPREEGKSVVTSRKDKMVSIAEGKKQPNKQLLGPFIQTWKDYKSERAESIITSHLQGPDVLFFPPQMDFIRSKDEVREKNKINLGK